MFNDSIVNIQNIDRLLEAEISAWQIEKYTGISRMMISNYRNGKTDIMKMSLENAKLLSDYYEEEKTMRLPISSYNLESIDTGWVVPYYQTPSRYNQSQECYELGFEAGGKEIYINVLAQDYTEEEIEETETLDMILVEFEKHLKGEIKNTFDGYDDELKANALMDIYFNGDAEIELAEAGDGPQFIDNPVMYGQLESDENGVYKIR